MTTNIINNIKQTLGFFSITIAWTLTNLLFSFYLVWTYGKTTHSGAALFFSGLFIYFAWAIFIIYPLPKLDHTKPLFKRQLFPFVTAVYIGLAYTILVGGFSRDFDFVIMFMPFALLIGLIFGLTYSTLIASDRIVSLLSKKPIFELILFLSPVYILTFFLWFLPTLCPSLVYRYVPDEIQEKILLKTIVKYRVGDSFEKLKNEVPGHFDNKGKNGFYSGPLMEYNLETLNDTIIKLDIKLHK